MVLNNSTCKLPIIGSEPMCILNSQWADQEVELWLMHGNNAWSGKLQMKDNQDAEEVMGLLSLTEEKYIEETKKALTTQGGLENFTYSLDREQFTWKKQVGKKMAIKFGFVQLSEISPSDIFGKIIDKMIQSTIHLNDKVQHYEKLNSNLASENQLLKDKLDGLISKKSEMESILYSQFLSLLNEKKRKISSLERVKRRSEPNPDDTTVAPPSSDPFDTDTEIDSEEDEQFQSPSKILICKDDENSENEEAFCSLPKRSRSNKSNEVQPSSSGVKTQTKNTAKSAKKDSKTTILPKRPGRKVKKESCVLGQFEMAVEKEDSNEDPFNFPNNSKPPKHSTKDAQTSKGKVESNIKEDSNKDITDSDRTPSGVEAIPLTTLTQKQKTDIDRTVQESNSHREDIQLKDDSPKEIPDERLKYFSSSTIDCLNNLF